MSTELSIVVVTYNSPEWTARCLDALFGDAAPSVPYEVVVVDSGSEPAAREALKTRAHQAKVVLVDGNIGFGRGCNLGVRHSEGTRVVLLNPDAVAHPGALDALVAFDTAHPEYGVVGGRTLRPDGTVDPSSCWGRPTLWSLLCFATGLSTVFKHNRWLDPESLGHWDRDEVREVDVVTGCLLLIRRQIYTEMGGFDPEYFLYGEDADLSLRARKAGWRPVITPDAVVTHAVGASSASRGDKHVLVLTGKATLARKHRRGLNRALAIGLLQAGVGLRAIPERLRGKANPNWLPAWRTRSSWRRGFPVGAPPEYPVNVVDMRSRGVSA